MSDRLTQLLGVASLAAVDRLREEELPAEADAGALVHLQAWPGTTVNELAGVVGRSQPATVRLVDRLVARGHVRRRQGPDRRTLALVLTRAGSRAASAVLAARAGALAPLLDGLSDRDRASLERILGTVVAGLADDRPGAVHACRLCDRGACMSGRGCPMEHAMAPGAPRPHVP